MSAPKTKQEIDDLKRQWSVDPCWDIETTEGFESARDELLIFRLEVENKSMRRELDRIADFRRELKEFLEG